MHGTASLPRPNIAAMFDFNARCECAVVEHPVGARWDGTTMTIRAWADVGNPRARQAPAPPTPGNDTSTEVCANRRDKTMRTDTALRPTAALRGAKPGFRRQHRLETRHRARYPRVRRHVGDGGHRYRTSPAASDGCSTRTSALNQRPGPARSGQTAWTSGTEETFILTGASMIEGSP